MSRPKGATGEDSGSVIGLNASTLHLKRDLKPETVQAKESTFPCKANAAR